jgi:L-arabinose transport system ATP-binding protein
VNHDQLVQAMVGRELGDIYHWQPRQYGPERLRLDSVKAPGVRTPISLSVRSGEIVGLFGLVGAGRSELMKGCSAVPVLPMGRSPLTASG